MGVGAAILALSNHAVKKLSDDKGSLDHISRFAKLVIDSAQFPKSTNDQSDNHIGENVNLGDTCNSPDNLSGAPKHGSAASTERMNQTEMGNTNAFEAPKIIQEAIEINEVSESSDISEEVDADIKEDSILDHLYKCRGDLIGSGWSSNVFIAHWKGLQVALKVWSGYETEGYQELLPRKIRTCK